MLDRNSEDGIITIYLGLILSILVAFVLTTIECARKSTAKSLFHETLETSMESSLCDYYLPLFERYHMFGLEVGDQELERQKEKVEGMVREKMEDSIYPEQDADMVQSLWNLSNQNFLMAYPDISKLKIDDCIFLTDERGIYAKDQMIAYMKYQAPMGLIEQCLSTAGVMEENKDALNMAKEKVRIDAGMGEVDSHALHIMELVEGLTYKPGQKLRAKDIFVKQIVMKEPSMEQVLVQRIEVFEALKNSYRNYSDSIDTIIDNMDVIIKMEQALEKEALEISSVGEQLKKEKGILVEVNQSLESDLKSTLIEVQHCIREAIGEIDALNQKREQLGNEYREYKEKLSSLTDRISEGLLQDLSREDSQTATYKDSSSTRISIISNIDKMKETLQFNDQLLNQVLELSKESFGLGRKGEQDYYNTIKSLLFQYRLDGLEFDYKGLNLTKESENLFDMIMAWLGNSMGEMVSKDLKLSECCISGDVLPSKNHTISENYEEEITIEDVKSGNYGYFGEMKQKAEDMDEKSIISPVFDSLLLSAYTAEHMTNFMTKSYRRGQVLAYEQEYIIAGKEEDKDNFNSITWRLLGFRLPGNICSVIIDPEKQQMAQASAILAVGWIPLAGLVEVVKYIILIYWAYCESVLEVAVLVHDKEVPVYTTKADFILQYEEIFRFSAELISQKVTSYQCIDQMKVGYETYLWIMMLFVPDEEIVLRCCDLIQENLRYEYDDSFKMSNCLISYHIEASGFLEQKFLIFPIPQKKRGEMDGYEILARTSVTY